MSTLTIILKNPGLSIAGLVLLFMGALSASIHPFQSLIGIQEIGLSENAFAGVMALASAASVIAAVLLGILGDRFANRRMLAILTSAAGTLGLALMLFAPGPVTFVICHGIAFPVATAIVGQTFALGRLALSDQPERRVAILSWLRACVSGTFLAALLVWNWFLRSEGALMAVYFGAFAVSFAMTVSLLIGWPRDGSTGWADARSGLNFRQAFREILRRPIMIRVAFMGTISSVMTLYGTLVALIFAVAPGRVPGDEALYMGLVAGWEVPAMLTLPLWSRGLSHARLMAVGGLLSGLHLVALQVFAGSPMIWGLTFLAGVPGAAFLTLQIPYLQDLLDGRPGTAGALLALQKLVGDVIAAAAFAVGTSLGGYEATAVIGGVLGCVGALGIMIADRRVKPA